MPTILAPKENFRVGAGVSSGQQTSDMYSDLKDHRGQFFSRKLSRTCWSFSGKTEKAFTHCKKFTKQSGVRCCLKTYVDPVITS